MTPLIFICLVLTLSFVKAFDLSKNSLQIYFQILGLATNASPEECRKAYRKLSLVHHPDRLPQGLGEEERKAARIAFDRITFVRDMLENYFSGVNLNKLRIPSERFGIVEDFVSEARLVGQDVGKGDAFKDAAAKLAKYGKYRMGPPDLEVHVAIPFEMLLDRQILSVPVRRRYSLESNETEIHPVEVKTEYLINPLLRPAAFAQGDKGLPGTITGDETDLGDVFFRFHILDSHPEVTWLVDIPFNENEAPLHVQYREAKGRNELLIYRGETYEGYYFPECIKSFYF